MAEPEPDSETPELDTLRALVAEIAIGDYRDRLGHRLTQNTAYLEALTVLEIREMLEQAGPPDACDGDHEGDPDGTA
jgi:hypothetical protein